MVFIKVCLKKNYLIYIYLFNKMFFIGFIFKLNVTFQFFIQSIMTIYCNYNLLPVGFLVRMFYSVTVIDA